MQFCLLNVVNYENKNQNLSKEKKVLSKLGKTAQFQQGGTLQTCSPRYYCSLSLVSVIKAQHWLSHIFKKSDSGKKKTQHLCDWLNTDFTVFILRSASVTHCFWVGTKLSVQHRLDLWPHWDWRTSGHDHKTEPTAPWGWSLSFPLWLALCVCPAGVGGSCLLSCNIYHGRFCLECFLRTSGDAFFPSSRRPKRWIPRLVRT